jgi:hypothetical protein
MESATRISQNGTGQKDLQARTLANQEVKRRIEESKDENNFATKKKQKEQMTVGMPQKSHREYQYDKGLPQ